MFKTIFEDGTKKAKRAPRNRYEVVFFKLNTLVLFLLNAFLVVMQPLRQICCGTWLFYVDVKQRLANDFDLVDKGTSAVQIIENRKLTRLRTARK